MMRGENPDTKLMKLKSLGRHNVINGHLDKIRHLANNGTQRAKASATGRNHVVSGHLDRIRVIARAVRKKNKEERIKKIFNKTDDKYKDDPDKLAMYKSRRGLSKSERKQVSENSSKFIIDNAERNLDYLQKVVSISQYTYVSPENLEFGSVSHAAKYYGGNANSAQIANWCKRQQHGWSRKPKI